MDIFSKDLILFPINYQACHWILAVVNVSQKVIYMYNSAGGKYVFSCFQLFLSFLSAEIQRKKKCDLGALNWDKLSVKCIPQQKNNFDCGVFILKFAESITRFGHHGRINFTQDNVPEIRQQLLFQIYHGFSAIMS